METESYRIFYELVECAYRGGLLDKKRQAEIEAEGARWVAQLDWANGEDKFSAGLAQMSVFSSDMKLPFSEVKHAAAEPVCFSMALNFRRTLGFASRVTPSFKKAFLLSSSAVSASVYTILSNDAAFKKMQEAASKIRDVYSTDSEYPWSEGGHIVRNMQHKDLKKRIFERQLSVLKDIAVEEGAVVWTAYLTLGSAALYLRAFPLASVSGFVFKPVQEAVDALHLQVSELVSQSKVVATINGLLSAAVAGMQYSPLSCERAPLDGEHIVEPIVDANSCFCWDVTSAVPYVDILSAHYDERAKHLSHHLPVADIVDIVLFSYLAHRRVSDADAAAYKIYTDHSHHPFISPFKFSCAYDC